MSSERMVDGVGLIGVGRVGETFVRRLVETGYEPLVFDVDPEAVETAVEEGAVAADSPAAVAADCEVLVLSLPDREAVETVMDGEDGVLDTLNTGQVVVDTSTVPPDVDARYQRRCHERDAGYVDCGITHGGDREGDPEFTGFVGGTTADYEQVRPVIETLIANHEFFEGIGNGHIAKLGTQMRAVCMGAITAETVEFLSTNGIDPERVVDALDWHVPQGYLDFSYPSTEGFDRAVGGEDGQSERRDIIDDSGSEPQLRTSDLAADATYALDVANASNSYAPMLRAAHQTMLAAENYGEALLDREVGFDDPEWRMGVTMLSVYRALNRPQEEWRRLGGGDG